MPERSRSAKKGGGRRPSGAKPPGRRAGGANGGGKKAKLSVDAAARTWLAANRSKGEDGTDEATVAKIVQLAAMSSAASMSNAELAAKLTSEMEVTAEERERDRAEAAAAKAAGQRVADIQAATWSRAVDPESGSEYFFNELTGEATWDAPPADAWQRALDPESGRSYVYHLESSAIEWEADEPMAADEMAAAEVKRIKSELAAVRREAEAEEEAERRAAEAARAAEAERARGQWQNAAQRAAAELKAAESAEFDTARAACPDLKRRELPLWRAFCYIDRDGSGSCGKRELFAALKEVGITDQSKLVPVYREVDKDRKAQIDFREFVQMTVALPGMIKLADRFEAERAAARAAGTASAEAPDSEDKVAGSAATRPSTAEAARAAEAEAEARMAEAARVAKEAEAASQARVAEAARLAEEAEAQAAARVAEAARVAAEAEAEAVRPGATLNRGTTSPQTTRRSCGGRRAEVLCSFGRRCGGASSS